MRIRRTRKQDFVLGVGSQRAGTTLLYEALHRCTAVNMHPIKELHYYDTLLSVRSRETLRNYCRARLNQEWDRLISGRSLRVLTPRYRCYLRANKKLLNVDISRINYRDLFHPMREGSRFVGEVTPEYMILPDEGVRRMRRDLGAQTRIILVARNPVRRLISAFKLLCSSGKIDLRDRSFSEHLEDTVKRSSLWMRRQDAFNDYRRAITMYRRHFENVLFLSYDDFSLHPDSVRDQLENFLNVSVNRRSFSRLLKQRVNALGETSDVDPSVDAILRVRYEDCIRFLNDEFGNQGCVL